MATDGTNLFHKEGVVIGGLNRADNTFHIASVDANGQINVNATFSGSISGNAAASATGSAVPVAADYVGVNIAGNLVGQTGFALTDSKAAAVAIVDGNGDQITSFGGGTQFADNVASGATPTGTLSMGWDSVNSKIRALKVDASQDLLVAFAAAQHAIIDSGSITVSGTVGVSGNVTVVQSTAASLNATVIFGAPQHVIVDSGSISAVDVTDRAARLLGVIYGSQAQQLKQTATNFNAAVELFAGGTAYDARSIRALTSADVVDVSDKSARLLGHVTVDNASLTVAFASAQHVIVDSGPAVDVTDRSARLLGHITVDNATLAVTQSTSPWITQDGADGTAAAGVPSKVMYVGTNIAGNLVGLTGFSLANSKPAAVAIVDASGNQIASFGGGTQFADNSASGATPTGTLSMGWDSANSLIRALKVDSSQNLLVALSGTSTVNIGNVPAVSQSGAWTVQANQGLPNTDANAWRIQTAQGDPQTDLLQSILMEIRGLRLAQVALVTEGGSYKESDFDPAFFEQAGDTYFN